MPVNKTLGTCCRLRRLGSELLLTSLPTHTGELIVLVATLIYAAQSVLSKVVEVNIPSMEVVLTRSVLGGAITLCTLLRVIHNGTWRTLTLSVS